MAILADTGVLYALADRSDAWHERCVAWLDGERERVLVPVTVVPEVCYLLASRIGTRAEHAFVASLAAGELAVEPLAPADLRRTADVLARQPDLGFVDASVVAMAERLRLARLATTDRRHFGGVRPGHVDRFELVP